MNKDKSLTASVKTTLYQREKLVDKIQFLLPQKYGDFSLSEFTATLKYVDQGNVPHAEILTQDEELYKEHVRYTLPIDTNLTQFCGDIIIRITLTKTDMETKTQYVLHTGETTITISPLSDWYKFIPDDALEVLDQKMVELETKLEAAEKIAEVYDSSKADNIKLDNETNEIYLTSNGIQVGTKIAINDLGDSIVENTQDGMISVIIE